MQKIAVAGLGYVGLSNAVLLARQHMVYAFDISKSKVDKIAGGESPIADNDIVEHLANGNLNLVPTCDPDVAFSEVDFVIIATPTNYDPASNSFDTKSVTSCIRAVMARNDKATIIIKSTIPIGFVSQIRVELGTDRIVFSPEFLREGRALFDNLHPSRIIVGDCSIGAQRFASILLNAAISKDVDVLFVGTTEAEAIKLFSNSYLAMRVGFFNELDNFAIARTLNSREIVEGVCLDPRIGSYYNNPSFGYGGYCLPKDTKQLLANFDGVPQSIVTAIVETNEKRLDFLAEQIIAKGVKTVGMHRLAMKAGADNNRDSSSRALLFRLVEKIPNILLFEPNLEKPDFEGVETETNLATFKTRCDLILTNRMCEELDDVKEKLFTRDLFGLD